MMKKRNCESEKNLGKIEKVFEEFSGHCLDNFTSFEKFTEFLHKPVDGASLGVGRMSFGLMMLIDIPEERSGGDLDQRWGNPRDCRFPLFNFLHPLPLPWMAMIYGVMWLGALGIFLGYKYRSSCLMFTIPYWYIFFLDKSHWNNHSYLYGLLGILALDAGSATNGYKDLKVPQWNYFIIKFQFFILYFMAGIKKFSTEWLSGYAMTNLGYHWIFAPFRLVLGADLTDLMIIHWFGFVFDLTIAFFLIWKRSRALATLVAAAFHLMNSRLFTIGMFPWVCLVEIPLFYSTEWPRRIFSGSHERKLEERTEKFQASSKQKSRTRWIMFYMGLQLFLPYSHFITKGYNNWTEGLYGYSWDMMVHSWDTVLITIKVVDKTNGQAFYLEPYAFADNDRWTKHADMAIQYAECLKRDLVQGAAEAKKKDFDPENIAIYFDIWCSMNKRFQQRMFDP
uniref:HTTM-like domain-containing protein n=1 Tax=Phlebotomus papatasi TaxID=29031 RepID=A0A1B0F0M8_PHLPP